MNSFNHLILTIILLLRSIIVFPVFATNAIPDDVKNNRTVLNKVLPPSPSYLDKDVDVVIEFTVMPDGTVGDMRPATKGNPALESISLKTLKKWRFNAIDTDIIMKGQITFRFKAEGGLETDIEDAQVSKNDSHSSNNPGDVESKKQSKLLSYKPAYTSISSSSNTQHEDGDISKYYAVHHGAWGTFMNENAVWIDNMVLCHEGTPKELHFTTPKLESGLYEFEIAADDNAELYIDEEKVTSFSSFGSSEKFKMKLEKGIHEIKVVLQNIVLSKTNWIDNAIGAAIVIRDQKNKVVLTSRDSRFCHTITSTPVTYPMDRGYKLMQEHGVWINYLGSLELDKPVEIRWEFEATNQAIHTFNIEADDVADIYIDEQYLDKVKYSPNETSLNYFLSKGKHSLKVILTNFTNNNNTWDKNPCGIAILIKNKAGEKVFSSRDYASPIPEHLKEKKSTVQDSKITNQTTIQTHKASQILSVIGESDKSIPTVKIGNQVWMAKNLDVSTFRNGDIIPQARTNVEWFLAGKNKQPAWCFYNNDSREGAKYGKLYNWYAVNDPRGLAPIGYHIPSDEEWEILEAYLKKADPEIPVGIQMMSSIGWLNSDSFREYRAGFNVSGFSGLPGGSRSHSIWQNYNGKFANSGLAGDWWTCTEWRSSNGEIEKHITNAWYRSLGHGWLYLGRNSIGCDKAFGMSVRCVKN